MLLALDTFELNAGAPAVLKLLGDDPRFKLELPASQIEIETPSASSVREVAAALLQARRFLVDRAGDRVRFASAGVHPFSPGLGKLNRLRRYEHTIREHGRIAERQLVCALRVHVSVGDADRALAIYNAARSYLPLIAALAANAPFYEGSDTGLASVRPKLGELLPRQGIPPVIDSWEQLSDVFRWGHATGTFSAGHMWWWELRLHPSFGTLEFRVPDAQTTVADAEAIAAVTQALVVWLGDRHDAGERLPVATGWQIEQNRWSACRHGVEGEMAALDAGTVRATRSLLQELLATLAPVAAHLQSQAAFAHARRMVEVNGALAQRRAAREGGARRIAQWLSERFLEPPRG